MDTLYEELVFNDNSSPDINASNLNRMSHAIAEIDERVVRLGAYEVEAQASATSAAGSVTLCQAEVTKAKAEVTKAQQEAESARGYAEQAHYYSDHAFSGTPEGYSQLVDDVYSLHTTENKDFGSVKGKIMPIRIDGKSEKTDSVIRSVGDYGLVDLGSLDWSINNASASAITFKTTLNGVKRTASSSTVVDTALCIGYTATSGSAIGIATSGKMFAIASASDTLYVCNPAFNGKSGTEVKTMLSGTMLCYELASGSTSTQYGLGLKEHGKNLWDEVWEVGALNDTTGEPSTSNVRIRSKNFIGIHPSTNYCTKSPNLNLLLFAYDSNKSVIQMGTNTKYLAVNNGTFTTPSNARYLKFYTASSYGTTYNNDIAIIKGTSATEYVPYENDKVILPLSAPLRSVGTVKDTIEDGKIIRRVGCVDLATAGFTYSSTYSRWQCSALAGMRTPPSNDTAFIGIAENYNVNSANAGSSGDICVNIQGGVRVYSDSTQPPCGKLFYALATPTTEELTPSQQKALCSLKSYDGHTYLEAVGLEPTMSLKYADYEVSAVALEGYVDAQYNRALIEDNLATVQAMILELETES